MFHGLENSSTIKMLTFFFELFFALLVISHLARITDLIIGKTLTNVLIVILFVVFIYHVIPSIYIKIILTAFIVLFVVSMFLGATNAIANAKFNQDIKQNLNTPKPCNRVQNGYLHSDICKMKITSGLIIRHEPLEKILIGAKTWEMRPTRTTKRGRIALIKKGTNLIYGVASVVDCKGPLSRDEVVTTEPFHRITQERYDNDFEVRKWRFAWVLESVVKLKSPIPYIRKSGPVIFVNLDDGAIEKLHAALESTLSGQKPSV